MKRASECSSLTKKKYVPMIELTWVAIKGNRISDAYECDARHFETLNRSIWSVTMSTNHEHDQ